MFAAEIGFSHCEDVLRNAYVGKAKFCVQLRSLRQLPDGNEYNLRFKGDFI
jgi:hypothetical protein